MSRFLWLIATVSNSLIFKNNKMSKEKPLTVFEQQFIKENRLKMSMNDMSIELNMSYSRLRNFMVKNKLTVPKDVVKQFQASKMKAHHQTGTYKEKVSTSKHGWWYDAYAAR